MADLRLPIPEGYDPSTQAVVGTFAASLDDQLRRLRKKVDGFEVAHLEWQERPGHNTLGMHLAHLALVEIYWIIIAPRGLGWGEEASATLVDVIGVPDDGFPLAAGGTHPSFLAGFTLERYDTMLSRARARIHEELRTWTDASLDETYTVQAGGEQHLASRRWILYHVLEHFAAHVGHVGLIKHMLRDRDLVGS